MKTTGLAREWVLLLLNFLDDTVNNCSTKTVGRETNEFMKEYRLFKDSEKSLIFNLSDVY